MNLTNTLGLPRPIALAMEGYGDDYIAGRDGTKKTDFSVTTLEGPPLLAELKRRYDAELTEDVSDRLYALMGSAIHAVLERAGRLDPLLVVERRLFTSIRGQTISGQIDLATPVSGGWLIQDWKMASVWEAQDGIKPSKVNQLNSYAELWRRNGLGHVVGLQDVFLYRDHSKRKAKTGEHPAHPMAVLDAPLWPQPQAEAYLNDRVRLHVKARSLADGAIPVCEPEERWEKETIYAVKKVGAKRAESGGLCKSIEEAETFINGRKGFFFEKRAGEPVRCAGYCAGAPKCPWYRAYLGTSAPALTEAR